MNDDVLLTLDEGVAEVLGLLTGLDLQYAPQQDRYYSIARAINRALRSNALEKEWSYYSSTENLGPLGPCELELELRSSVRARMINDDCVRLVDCNGKAQRWAYFLPRDALHKYAYRSGLWASLTRNTIMFSRPFTQTEQTFDVVIPVMREPIMFRLPAQPEDPNADLVTVPTEIREQEIDFQYPDLITLRAAYYYAQTDPVMQPRVQTLEAQMKDLMYQIIERDDRMTDSPFQNEFTVPILNSVMGPDFTLHGHPHADERR